MTLNPSLRPEPADPAGQRAAVTALREARVLSDLIWKSSRDCIVVMDAEGRTLTVSPGGVESMEITDVTPILGLSWLRVWEGADHAAAVAAVAAARAGGTGRFVGFCPTHKGTPKWWDVVISPLPGGESGPSRLVSVGRDITERMQAQTQFLTVAEAMPNHVWTARPDGLLDWFNAQVYAYSGAGRGTLDGQGWVGIVHPDDVPAAAQRWAAALDSGQAYEAEFRLRGADGGYRWHIARALPVAALDGQRPRWVGTNTDIHDKRLAQEALATLNASLGEQVEARTRERDRAWKFSQDLQAILDTSGVFRSVNDKWAEVLGWQPGELVGRHFLEFVHPDDHPGSNDALATATKSDLAGYENRYLHKTDGFRWIAWVATHDENSVIASGRHITAQKKAEADLAASQEQLRQSQKMEAVGQLTGGISHDFNNILQVISGNLYLLRRMGGSDERAAQRIDIALDAVRRGAKLASQLLGFSRRLPLAPKVIHAGRLLAALEDMLQRALGETIALEYVVSSGLWNTLVDPAQVENSVLNLAINARDAMQGSGKLTIEVGNAYLDDAYAMRHPGVQAGQYVMVAVSDTGCGMTPEVVARAFEPFFSTKPVGSGTGLGLSMVYGFVIQSGGHVKIYSELGQGTTMKLYLPRSLEAEESLALALEKPFAGGPETILVAEDDEGVRAIVVEMLSELGYRVLQAKDTDGALSVLESGVEIDLLFSDVVMPGSLKSPELARHARSRSPRIAVLFTSGYTQNAIVHGGRLDAGVDLLVKPYSRDELARKVRQVLADRPHPTPRRTVLHVEDDPAVRASTVEMLTALGYPVVQAADAEAALRILAATPVDVLMADLGLPGMSGDVLAAKRAASGPTLPSCSSPAARSTRFTTHPIRRACCASPSAPPRWRRR